MVMIQVGLIVYDCDKNWFDCVRLRGVDYV